jgi:hypothetical protein
LIFAVVVDRSRYLVSFGRKNKEEVPMGPMVRPGRKRKGSVDDTPANKKPRPGAENGTPANTNPPLGAESTYAPEDHIDLPRGTLVTCVAGIELQPEDVGAAIQFLEFCRLFGEVVMEAHNNVILSYMLVKLLQEHLQNITCALKCLIIWPAK